MRLPLASVIMICLTVSGCVSNHWHDKAVPNEQAASQRVGGFSAVDAKLYHQGLQHIQNSHERIGAFTIGQVIDQERGREEGRAAARQQQATRDAQARERRLDSIATTNLTSTLKLGNSVGPALYRAGVIEGDTCSVKIDGDYFENDSEQDKSIIRQTIVSACSASYTELGGNDSRSLPESGLRIRVYNLADDAVYSDLLTRAPDAPAAGTQPRKLANADPHGAYKVLQHWDIPCSGRGGFGEKVMVLSHRQADLEATYKRWMAEHNLDKTQCISFMAYASEASFDAAEHPSQYTDAQLESIPEGLDYMNNPNTGAEWWSAGGGPVHELHKGSE